VRSKNAVNILVKNMLDPFIAGISYWLFGFAFAYGMEGYTNPFIGFHHFAAHDMSGVNYAEWFFQFVFAATASTIVSGAVAERCAFVAFLVYAIILTGFIYPVVSHWGWAADGFLVTGGYQDFAGSGIVHLCGGVAAFVGAFMLGPRLGRYDSGLFDKDKQAVAKAGKIEGHSVPLAALGGFLLIVGFFSFNGGSALQLSSPGDGEVFALAVMNTILAAGSSGIVGLLVNRISFTGQPKGKWSMLLTINAMISGMVSICASCNRVHPWAAVVIGGIAALVMLAFSWLMDYLEVDDPLDAVAVHFGGGLWGVLAAPFFQKEGLFYGYSSAGKVLGYHVAAIVVITVWTGGLCAIMFGILKYLGMLRVDRETEILGMDIVKHGEPAYPVSAYGGDFAGLMDRGSSKGLQIAGVPIVAPNFNYKPSELIQPKSDFKTTDQGHENAVFENSGV
jgi:Amt family ammonium transporter